MSLLDLGRGARVLAVSPHLDDAVFSIGASLAEAAESGMDVVNLTVFAGLPGSRRPPGPWDREARFSSDGAAVARRRIEDETACGAIGISPHWLPFRDDQYGDDRSEIADSLLPALADAELILIPGFPLLHPDHRWVAELVWSEREQLPPIGFYVEQPYAEAVWYRNRELPEAGGGAASILDAPITWRRNRPRLEHWRLKAKGFAAYSSQLGAMTRPGARVLIRVLAYDARRRGEWLALPDTPEPRRVFARKAGEDRRAPAEAPTGVAKGTSDGPANRILPAAIVLGGFANAISVARALNEDGVAVYALGQGSWDAVEHSRSVREYFRPDETPLQEGWLAWLEHEASRLSGAVLLPCGDDGLELIARNRHRLVDWGYRPFVADDQVVLTMLDKEKSYELAERIGIPYPRTVALTSEADGVAATARLAFPFALKPMHSHVFMQRVGGGKAIVVSDEAELQEALERTVGIGVGMMATEIVPGGPDQLFSYYSYIDPNGVPLFHMTKRKLRQSPIGFGVASYGRTEWNAHVAELGSRLFVEGGVRGLAEAEFKHDRRDGRFKLIECNHRFTGSNELVRRAGIDLAVLTYNRAIGNPDPPLDTYRDSVYLWGPILDVHAFLELRARGELTTRAWARSLLHRQHLQVFRATDPKPTLFDVTRRARLLVAGALRRRR